MRTDMVLKMFVYLPFNSLMQPLAWESFTEFSHHKRWRLYITRKWHSISSPSYQAEIFTDVYTTHTMLQI